MTTNEKCNGWTNYESWCIFTWLSSDQGTDETMRDLMNEYREPNEDPDSKGTFNRVFAAIAIRDFVDDMNPLTEDASMFSDLLTSALQKVNWEEIAEAFAED